ncbi:MAG: hypothetical protein ACD_15C00138G0004 [uncultured bacterium]|nr:MAG: hypothetical protein ACD_15C00138G0004 [uncultured bacterium]HCU71178.1 hypothetical protein [Candidatus Moranbacteria bacterium]
MTTRAILLVDFANFDCAIRKIKEKFGFSKEFIVNYKKLIRRFIKGHEVIESNIYIGLKKNSNNHHGFFDYFKKDKYQIITKEEKAIKLDDGSTKYKANFDVEIAFDACWHLAKGTCDEIILVSGDSDFSYLVKKIKALDLPIKIVSSNATVSSELKDGAFLLDDIDISQYLFKRKI